MPLEPPDQKRWEAASGYVQLGMYLEAGAELDEIDPFCPAAPLALELPMAAPGYWKGNRAGGGAALPTSVTSNADKVWVVYLQA